MRASPSVSPIETQVSVTTASASRTAASGSWVTTSRAPSPRAQPRISAGGESSGGQARRSVKSKRAAAWIQDPAMLFPSPDHATVRPRIGPRCSSKVITSAITWQGWVRSVRPLITGTVACSAISISRACEVVRIMIAST